MMMFLHPLMMLRCSGRSRAPSILLRFPPLIANFFADSRMAFWQIWLQHSLTESTRLQARMSLSESTKFSIASMSPAGHPPAVRFEACTEQISWRSILAPWLARIFCRSEMQWFACFRSMARDLLYIPDWPRRMTRVAWSCGQQITLARNGASDVQQSIAVVLIMPSAREKLSGHNPKIWCDIVRIGRYIWPWMIESEI